MEDNQQATAADDALDNAAAEVVETEEVTQETEEVVETPEVEQVAETETVEELDKNGLPTEHKQRSELGRKLSAVHRRIDETDNKFDRIMNYLETAAKPTPDELSPDEPVTASDLDQVLEARDAAREDKKKTYNDSYAKAIARMGPELGQDEYDEIIAELTTFTYDPSSDPARDAELNFHKAERMYLRKKIAKPIEKENPLTGKTPSNKPGVANGQKTVVKEAAKPKLDKAGESYLEFVRSEDGDDAANKLASG